jgi:tRNA pseudouridine38-40 synthase
LNGLLDADVRILDLVNSPYGFDARFAAIARTYSYSFSNGAPDPLYRNFVVPAWRKLDVEAMNQASEKLLGLNDFTAFCKRTQYGTSIRTLNQFDWRHTDFGVMATLEADAFCYSMVRSIVGCLLPVGEGRRDIDYPKHVLDSEVRHDDIVTMPAHGLVLEKISYAADAELMARQEITRARRENTEVEN